VKGVIFPELLSRRDDNNVEGAWQVHECSTARGEASCNLGEQVLEVPFESSELARVIRAHELMHAQVSPHAQHLRKALDDVSPRALECAEELRINTLLARLDFDFALMKDGTEKPGGRRVAEAELWPEAICFLVAVAGTGAEKEYMAGIRQGRAEWLPAMRAIRKRAIAIMSQSAKTLAATRLNDAGLPSGYAASTLVLARTLTQTMEARVPTNAEEMRGFRRSLEAGGRRPPTGRFASLVFDESLERHEHRSQGSIRRHRASPTGRVLRYPGRLVTDEQRRGFSTRVARRGGVVVIDQSGSMDLDAAALQTLLRQAPHALVVGYSHRPGDLGSLPNAWVLSDRDRVATSFPSGHLGNGVDGPVLQWALAQRQANEPMVWVTDGQVTDSHDHPDESLTAQCAELVRRGRIRLVRDLQEAEVALRWNRPMSSSTLPRFGRVGRKLSEHL
jgi:Mg-chelatase subunit ChlD